MTVAKLSLSETPLVVEQLSEMAANRQICRVLRGEKPGWPFQPDDLTTNAFFEHTRRHSVAPLVGRAVAGLDWPLGLKETYKRRVLVQAMWEMRHHSLISEVVAELAVKGVVALVIKGSALAYSVYPDPLLRRRGDTDLMIAETSLPQADAVLLRLGFKREGSFAPTLVYQSSYISDDGNHAIDLHWRISNSPVLANVLTFDELNERAVPIPLLCDKALAPSLVDSLMIGSFHRAAHKAVAEDRLIWLYDVHLLASSFRPRDWEMLTNLCARKEIAGVVAETLMTAQRRFGTDIPASAMDDLATEKAGRVTRYLAARPIRRLWMELSATDHAGKARRLFPSRKYLEERFGRSIQSWQAPFFHVRRVTEGIGNRLLGGAPFGRATPNPTEQLAGGAKYSSKFSRLWFMSWRDRRILGTAWIVSPLLAVQLRRRGLAEVLRRAEQSARRQSADTSPDDIRRIAELVNIGARRAITPATCLTRSVTLIQILKRQGVSADLRIGLDPSRSPYVAHAWVEYGGVVVNDAPDVAMRYPAFDLPVTLNALHLE